MTTLFNFTFDYKKITKPIRLIELFGGIGSQAAALENLGANFEHYRLCEFDQNAVNSYNAVHNTNFEPSDITQIHAKDLGVVDTDKYEYIMTYSFPCQDLSIAGKMNGMEKGSGTRSGLLWEVQRLLDESKELPQILVMENVSQVHNKQNNENFESWEQYLESKGYINYWEDLNAKDYGVPQNRLRTFMISLLGDFKYDFPEPIQLDRTLKDVLEPQVDESFYLSDKKIQAISKWKAYQKPFERVLGKNSICPTLTARGAGEEHSGMVVLSEKLDKTTDLQKEIRPELKVLGYATENIHSAQRIYDIDGLAPTVRENHGTVTKVAIPKDNLKRQLCNKLIEENLVKEGDVVRHSYSKNRLGNGTRIENKQSPNCCPALTTRSDCIGVVTDYRIRKLTPKECWRLMGFSDEQYERARWNKDGSERMSNMQLYKQAGNSIVVNVLMAIFKQML